MLAPKLRGALSAGLLGNSAEEQDDEVPWWIPLAGKPFRRPGKPPRVMWPEVRRPKKGPRKLITLDWPHEHDGFVRWTGRRHRSVGVMVTPEIRSTEPVYREFAADLADVLSEEFPPSKTIEGWYRAPAVPGNFLGLNTVAGIRMNPAGSPPLDRPTKATAFLDSSHERALEILLKLMSAKWTPAPYAISRIASTGPPVFTTDVDEKWRQFVAFRDAAADIGQAINSDSLERLYVEHGIVFAYVVGRRAQVDRVKEEDGRLLSADRVVTDWLGNIVTAAKYPLFDDTRHIAMRTRLVYAMSGSVNYGLGAGWAGFKHHLRDRYAFTWLAQDPPTMLARASARAAAFSLDVKNFDQNHPRFAIEYVVKNVNSLQPWFIDTTLTALRAPVLIPNDYEGGRGYGWSGDPFKLADFVGDYGNPSGLGPNYWFNWTMGAWLVLVGLIEVGVFPLDRLTEEGVDRWLQGVDDISAFWNSGDDNVLLFSDPAVARKAHAWFASDVHPYYSMKVEAGMTFLGTLFVSESGHRYAYPNPVSQVLNFLAPEKGVDSPHRRFAPFGWFERKRPFSSNPAHKRIDELTNDRFARYFSETLDDHLRRYLRYPPMVTGLNWAELQAILNRETVHYKIRLSDLRPSIANSMFLLVPEQDIRSLGERIMRAS